MKRIYLLLACVLMMGTSCDPPMYCTEPQCAYSDVYVNIAPELSGNLDAYVNVGDTIRFTLNIPDTLFTNYGELVFGQLYERSFFGVISSKADSFGVVNGRLTPYGVGDVPTYITHGTSTGSNGEGAFEWNMSSRRFECSLVLREVGKYSIALIPGRIEMKAKDGREWLVMPGHNFENIDRHAELFVSWWPQSVQAELRADAEYSMNSYYFEVR